MHETRNLTIHFRLIEVSFNGLRLHFKMMQKTRVSTNYGNRGFATPALDKPTKTPLSTLKQHENSHGVPGEPEIDVDVCEFEQRCLQAIQPPTLLFIQFTASLQFAVPSSNRVCTLRGNC
jgi:hypothetical protein